MSLSAQMLNSLIYLTLPTFFSVSLCGSKKCFNAVFVAVIAHRALGSIFLGGRLLLTLKMPYNDNDFEYVKLIKYQFRNSGLLHGNTRQN